MLDRRFLPAFLLSLYIASTAHAGQIIAELSGLPSPDHLEEFGADEFPNFTPITNEFPPLLFSHTRYFTTGSVNNMVGGFLTNDFSGAPDTLSIRFPAPIMDISYAYHQISQSQASVHRVLLNGAVVDEFSELSDALQPNNFFGFKGLLFDELQIDFVSDFNLDSVAWNEPVTPYCDPANPNSVSADGARLTSAGNYGTAQASFDITNIPNQPGLLFSGPDALDLPFGCGRRCVGGLVVRGDVILPMANQVQGIPFDMSFPSTLNIQYWYRDPANSGSCGGTFNLSNALRP